MNDLFKTGIRTGDKILRRKKIFALVSFLSFSLAQLAPSLAGGAEDETLKFVQPRNENAEASNPDAFTLNPDALIEPLGFEIFEGGEFLSGALTDALTNDNTGSISTAFFTQSETSLVAFGNRVVVSFNDSGSRNGNSKFTGFAYSTNGGTTFTDGGTLPTNANGDAGDPVLARNNTTGRLFFSTLQFSGSGINMFRSDDNGLTWLAPTQAAPGKTGFQDKQWHTVDNFAGPGGGNVYLVERDFGAGEGIFFFRSTDNGETFGPGSGTLIASGSTLNVQGAFVTVRPDHSINVFYFDENSLPERIMTRRSIDQGLTFGAPVVVATLDTSTGFNGDLGLTGLRQGTLVFSGFRSNAFPHASVNPVSGDIYVVFNDNPAGADKADVYMVISTDGGLTWSAQTRVNDDATTTDQWQPTLAVTPDGSKLGIFYYSREEDVAANNLFKYYGRIGSISGATVSFQPSSAVSSTLSPPEFGRDNAVNSVYMGDYNTAAATPGAFHVAWSDNRDDLPGGGDRKDPSVYYNIIPLNNPPVADAGPDQTVQCTSPAGAPVTLNGSGSTDPDGDPLSYLWTNSFPPASGQIVTVTMPIGTQTVMLTVDDGKGGTDTDTMQATVQDTTPPSISAITPSKSVLWPPNHKMVPLTVAVAATDICSSSVSCKITSVSSNEPINGTGDGDTGPDWEVTKPLALNLRAERAGTGNGRVYTIALACKDGIGNTATGTTTVNVPKSQ